MADIVEPGRFMYLQVGRQQLLVRPPAGVAKWGVNVAIMGVSPANPFFYDIFITEPHKLLQ